ncbi:MAG: oxalate/formate MFS antiporter [Candidatus Thermoplasmatota archaeon]|nr:oxalate/formate MFS antiporter [Candidatus Thermoplasmatota archaeon]
MMTGNRGYQLFAGFIIMVVISNYQYAFTLFTDSLQNEFLVAYSSIAVIYSLFLTFQTWPNPISGYLIDRFGLRKLLSIGALLIGLGWVLCCFAPSVAYLYVFYGGFCGIGAGMLYIGCQGNAVKWFPDRRGLATGLTAAGFGGGAALTIIPVSMSLGSLGWRETFLVFGIAQGVIALVMALTMRSPPVGWKPQGWDEEKVAKRVSVSKKDHTWHETLRRPEFWILYLMFALTVTGGLMITGNMRALANDFGVSGYSLFGVEIVALASTATAVSNAAARVGWGGISDRLGRENTMAISFGLEAVVLFVASTGVSRDPVFFIVMMAIAILCWGQVYSLYSASVGDIFGAKYATVNYGMLYTSKGIASWLAGFGAAAIASAFESWVPMLHIIAVMNLFAALLAILVVKKVVKRRISAEG